MTEFKTWPTRRCRSILKYSYMEEIRQWAFFIWNSIILGNELEVNSVLSYILYYLFWLINAFAKLSLQSKVLTTFLSTQTPPTWPIRHVLWALAPLNHPSRFNVRVLPTNGIWSIYKNRQSTIYAKCALSIDGRLSILIDRSKLWWRGPIPFYIDTQ